MGRELNEVSFEDWLRFVFDHPVTDPAWHLSTEADAWAGGSGETLQHLKRTFRDSGTALIQYSDAQLDQGFLYLVSNSYSDIAYCMVDTSIPWPEREDCMKAIADLFRQCFQARCTSRLSHLDEPGAGGLNSICYMWWDVLPIHGQPEVPERRESDVTILSVMERTLGLESDACRESALHGLGHWEAYYPDRVHSVIDHFIWSNRKIRDSLRNYAYAARHGDVL